MKVGSVMERNNVSSSLGPFYVLPDYKIQYPETVIQALGELYLEYNRVFTPLVEANREWQTDYQYAMRSGSPVNFAVQIDMIGLPDYFLEAAVKMSEEAVHQFLRTRIFEIENSIAMYQLLENLFSNGSGCSGFKNGWRVTLDELAKKHGMPIALLAVTKEKYDAMKSSEFGKGLDEPIIDEEVRRMSGFDRLFGPEEFCEYLSKNKGECGYLLFVRSSDPVHKLRRPEIKVEHPLLGNPEWRKIIKAHSLTFNIDNPCWSTGDSRIINDTKEYMPPMGMAFPFTNERNIYSHAFAEHLLEKGYSFTDFPVCARLVPKFSKYIESFGISSDEVASGTHALRFKPMKNAYGCYGHIIGALTNRRIRQELRQNVRTRGPYLIQPELTLPTIFINGREYTYIDRNFFSFTGRAPRFIGGFRSLMPLDSNEAQNNRNHGSKYTIWAEILGN